MCAEGLAAQPAAPSQSPTIVSSAVPSPSAHPLSVLAGKRKASDASVLTAVEYAEPTKVAERAPGRWSKEENARFLEGTIW